MLLPAEVYHKDAIVILEGKATGETILKTIENIVNGGKEDIGEPERRSLNEIKESVIRVKTAPEMDLIARSEDLNSPEVLEKLKIEGIEKFNPDNPDLPENVRARLDELAAEGKTIGAFYDKTTDKIFVNENLEDDAEIRASIAREWKIAEDLNAQKGKANEEGKLKSTVAGELVYDDILKRSREGKTGSISTDELKEAVMDADSEVTSDKEIVKPEAFQKAWIDKDKKALNGKTGEENVKSAFFKQTGKEYTIDWKRYKNGTRANDLYVMKMNYYYFQAERFVTIEEFNRDRKNYMDVRQKEAVFHNIVNGKINIGENKNKKYVNYENGKEVVIDSKGNVVKDPINRGTANRYTYIGDNDPDKKNHGVDVSNWIIWGTGIDDKSNVYERIRLSVLGGIVSTHYEEIDKWAKGKGISLIGEAELFQFSIDKGKTDIMNLFRQEISNLKDKYDNSLNFNPEVIAPSMYLGR